MKYANFAAKLACFVITAGILAGYQNAAAKKADIMAGNEAEVAAAEEYNKEIEAEIRESQAASDGEASAEETGPFKDGTYEGSGTGFGGEVKVSVTVKGGYMDSVEVVSASGEDPAYFEQAQGVIDEMLEAQSADVDTISGATFSSTGLIEAVDDAIWKAVDQDEN